MKKYILLLGVLISFGTWAKCPEGSGILLTGGAPENIEYCQSKIDMNWWSAFTWCNSIGGEVIDLTYDCMLGEADDSEVACPYLNGIGRTKTVWTRNVPHASHAYVITKEGNVSSGHSRDYVYQVSALCRMSGQK